MSAPSAHYTLPGVMHYLQTEYTKNERDRINWELERCEMKSRIARLEGENRDLKSELVLLQNKIQETLSSEKDGTDQEKDSEQASSHTDSTLPEWEQEQELLNSRLSVQENIKEIVYLLKSPPLSDQLESWSNKGDSTKKLESLNLFANEANKDRRKHQDSDPSYMIREQTSEGGQINDKMILTDKDPKDTNGANWNDMESINRSIDEISDAETIINSRRTRSSSLFSTRSNEMMKFHTYRFLQYHLSPISKLKLHGNSMLSFGSDGLLKHWLIEPNLNSNEKATKAFHSVPNLLGIFWLNKTGFMTVDEISIKMWNVDQSEPLVSWDGLKDLDGLQSVDFKNKWLVLAFANEIRVWEIKIGPERIEKMNEYVIAVSYTILKCLIGLTEKSLIVLNGDSKKTARVSIFDFQGSLLQNLDISNYFTQFHFSNNELSLNRATSMLLVKFDSETLIYSFDQKKTILVTSTPGHVVSSIFLNDLEYIVTALQDGCIVIKSIKEDGKIIRKYNHYEHPEKTPDDVQAITIACTTIDDTPVIVSGGFNGVIRLEKIMNL